MTIYAYVRASVFEQDTNQFDFLSINEQKKRLHHFQIDKFLVEESPVLENSTRTLDENLKSFQPGDVLVVTHLHRLGRDNNQLQQFLLKMEEKNVKIQALDAPGLEQNGDFLTVFCTYLLEQEKKVRKEKIYVEKLQGTEKEKKTLSFNKT